MSASVDLTLRVTHEFTTLRATVDALGAQQLWLENNRPWRMMVETNNAHFSLAEQSACDDSLGVPGDGQWPQGKAVCDVVNSAIKLTSLLKEAAATATEADGSPSALIGALLAIATQDPAQPDLDRDWAQKKAMAALRGFLCGKEPEVVRHITRGYTYLVLGPGRVQTSRPLNDMEAVVQYCGVKGDLWSRPPDEFQDGRFEPVKTKRT